ncbi:hypothetical protein FJQ98_14190 [Lysinibacillus agricola]|uniref:Uncharacterized protein n=1 Tax=Lysinibacillus agricola TaxID=2590012 RepID=A0ABX7AKT3_9BACI|nr:MULTISPECIES: hypothetical protein [Lysinibacillus]KOS64641.1 hypothetical protein AN161_01050 [Lysinibacillus sp. FJAT-14222]QQP10438.1 hypothetical protein FJQ98_14190 [Lysinibacillus agricola]
MAENTKKQIQMYGHDFEYIEIEKFPLSNEVRVQVNYSGYPESIGIGSGESVEIAVDNTIKKILKSSPLEVIKCLYD